MIDTNNQIAHLTAQLNALRRQMPGGDRLAGGLEQGLMAVTAAICAYLPTRAVGLREGFWAAITAIAVVQTEFGATRNTARDQFTGAAIGGLIGGVVASTVGQHIWSYAGAVVAAILVAWLAKVASAARLAGITATIILLVPHAGTATSMVVARVAEVSWGGTVALLVVWLAGWLRLRRPIKPKG